MRLTGGQLKCASDFTKQITSARWELSHEMRCLTLSDFKEYKHPHEPLSIIMSVVKSALKTPRSVTLRREGAEGM